MILLAVLSIAISSFSTFAQEEGDLQTVSQRLEIFYNGKWGTVCSRDFDDVDARVACKQLGFRNGTTVGKTAFRGEGTVWKSYVNCNGTENKLMDCKDNGPNNYCSHSEDVGVDCFNDTFKAGELRLISGRLEIFYTGIWGTVCDDGFTDINAQVACRQLGYNNGIFKGSTKKSEKAKVWLDNVDCSGKENGLSHCDHSIWGVNDCFPSENVEIKCLNASEGDVRISTGLGKIEIFHNNEWGTVCRDNFDTIDAIIACKQIGYSNGSVLDSVPTRTTKIWLSELNCRGEESKLLECEHAEWGTNTCNHGNVVAIHCFEGDGDVRINSSRLEIYYDKTWGTVCDEKFDDRDATIACKQLGHNSGKVSQAAEYGTGRIWLSDLHCSGNERKLSDCLNSGWGEVDCSHMNDVGVKCFDSEEGAIRINSHSYELKNSGRLEIFHNKEWGSVCSKDFEDTDATVACKQLGYEYGEVSGSLRYDTGKIWLTEVNCEGGENKLTSCYHAGWGKKNCTSNIRIACDNETSDFDISNVILVAELVIFVIVMVYFFRHFDLRKRTTPRGCPSIIVRDNCIARACVDHTDEFDTNTLNIGRNTEVPLQAIDPSTNNPETAL